MRRGRPTRFVTAFIGIEHWLDSKLIGARVAGRQPMRGSADIAGGVVVRRRLRKLDFQAG